MRPFGIQTTSGVFNVKNDYLVSTKLANLNIIVSLSDGDIVVGMTIYNF